MYFKTYSPVQYKNSEDNQTASTLLKLNLHLANIVAGEGENLPEISKYWILNIQTCLLTKVKSDKSLKPNG